MTDPQPPASPPVTPPPERRLPPPRRPSRVLGVLFGMSLMLNLLVLAAIIVACVGFSLLGRGKDETAALSEHYHSGKKSATDKIAIVTIDGVLLEGMNGYAEKQIEQAARDSHVKAVVVRINSPGGSVTSADDLYHRLTRLRDGDSNKGTSAKKIVASMDSVAASGGYYIAMPASHIYAERTTLTGSIGVYASFFDMSGLNKEYHLLNVTYIKRGAVKASGNPFYKMTDEEYAMWDDMVGHAYDQFLDVVKEGRGDRLTKTKDLTATVIDEKRKVPFNEPDDAQHMVTKIKEVHYTRQLADGGVWTADKAKEFGLIDDIGYLEDALKKAHDLAGMGDDWKAVTYERPSLLTELLLGGSQTQEQASGIDPAKLANAATPRLWYLAPGSELAGMLRGGTLTPLAALRSR